jgi:prefoldin subunit 5
MTLTKEHLQSRLQGLQEQFATAQANLEALSGAIQMLRALLHDLEQPEPANEAPGPKLVKPTTSTTELQPALEGESG